MSIVDIIIIVILLLFAIIGFKRGVLKSLVSFIGFILVIYLAYLFKNYLGDIFVTDLPFFDIKIGSITSDVMNVVMYQTIAFIIIAILLGLVYKAIMVMSGIIEKIFTLTIVLGIPSKILGLVVGVLEGFIIVYLALFFIAQPYVKMDVLEDSKYANTILTKTPVLSKFANSTLEIINEVKDTIESGDTDDFDLKLSDLVLKHKVTSPEVMDKLVKNQKINVKGIEDVIDKYKSVNDEEGI